MKWFKQTFNIWDKVTLTQYEVERVYTIYSITEYMGWRKVYTLWSESDYESYEDWQFKPYEPKKEIWFNT